MQHSTARILTTQAGSLPRPTRVVELMVADWNEVTLPDHRIIIPGVIDSTTNVVEHPELVADRIVQYANIVGREQVMAVADCSFGAFAGRVQVDSTIVWMKLGSLTEGAGLASRQLW